MLFLYTLSPLVFILPLCFQPLQNRHIYIHTNIQTYPKRRNFHWNSNFAISLMAKSLNLNSDCYHNIRNFSIIAFIIEIQNQNLLIFNPVTLTNLSQVAKLNSKYIFILKGKAKKSIDLPLLGLV